MHFDQHCDHFQLLSLLLDACWMSCAFLTFHSLNEAEEGARMLAELGA